MLVATTLKRKTTFLRHHSASSALARGSGATALQRAAAFPLRAGPASAAGSRLACSASAEVAEKGDYVEVRRSR